MTVVLTNCRVVADVSVLPDHALVLEGTRVAEVVPAGPAEAGADTFDLDGAFVGPAFIDLQVNGGGGILFADHPTLEGLSRIAAAHAGRGTLRFLPTILSAAVETMMAAADAVREARNIGMDSVLGLHLEGPYISPARKGAHDSGALRPLSDTELLEVLLPMSDVLRVLTVSPDMVTAAQIGALSEAGVVVLLGHSDASYDDALEAFACGAAGVTHIFNAMSPMTRDAPGLPGAALASPTARATIIVDGHHVHPGAVLVAKRAMGDRLLLVSDAMPPVGGGADTFRLGPYDAVCIKGRCERPDGGLAGSAVDLAGAVRTCVHTCGIELADAWRMASAGPAALLGRSDCGSISAGMPADLAILDHDLRVAGVVQGGEVHLTSDWPG